MDLTMLIELAHRQAHREWIKSAPKTGLTHSEYTYLSAIKNQEATKTDKNDHGQHLHEVVAEMGVKKASASAMVVKLEDRGFVEGVPCQYDARAQHILLTSKGRAALEMGKSIYEAAANAMMTELGGRDRETLVNAFAE